MRIAPPAQLFPIHPELAPDNLAQLFIDTAKLELTYLEAHRSAAVAAAAHAALIAKMKRGAYIVNMARGKICDRDAIARALESGQLAG